MNVPLINPDALTQITCADQTCGAVFTTPKPVVEIINQTQLDLLVLYHQVPAICPKCGATYRFVIAQVSTGYQVIRMDVDLVAPSGLRLAQ